MSDSPEEAIPIAAHPDPVLSYANRDGTVVVTATNSPFEAAFGAIKPGEPVASIFDGIGVVETTGDGTPTEHMRRGEAVGVVLDGLGDMGPAFARVIPTEGGGHLVVIDLEAGLDVLGTAGAERVASVLGHDIRNPLDVATAHLRAARETGEAEHFDAVADAHDRIAAVISDVLTLARGREAVSPSEGVNVGATAQDAWSAVDTGELELDNAVELPSVTADRDRLRRAFENLFRNAVDHADGATTVRVGALDDGIFIEDDGAGINPAERSAVLEPGYSTADGTGLGLTIVEGIVSAHGWTLTVTKGDAGGARFEIRW